MQTPILVLNCGSSSLKFALFEQVGEEPATAPWRGLARELGTARATFEETDQAPLPLQQDEASPQGALRRVVARVRERLQGQPLRAVAHRVVHGGSRYLAPEIVDPAVLAELRRLIPLAPLHQPFALEALEVLLHETSIAQVACFDTAFHRDMPEVEQVFALPHALRAHGLRRFGFHGLSYEYLACVLPQRHGGHARGRVIAAHLGSGASLCAMHDLRSVTTTMGFSALDGLMMGTRCGSLDPGALLYLMQVEHLDVDRVAQMLYHESGLLGVSGLSSDPRELLRHEDDGGEPGQRVRLALDLYIRRIVREIGALAAVLGGLDMLVFTAGVGEHNAEVRRRVCRELSWIGVELDDDANASHQNVISTSSGRVRVAVEPTNEEWVAARHAAALMLPQGPR